MRKLAIAMIIACFGFIASAQGSGDFFSDDNDDVLEKARQKYEQAQDDEDNAGAKAALRGKKNKDTGEEVLDVETSGDPSEPDYKVAIKKRPRIRHSRNRDFILFIRFLGLADFFGWTDIDIDIDIDNGHSGKKVQAPAKEKEEEIIVADEDDDAAVAEADDEEPAREVERPRTRKPAKKPVFEYFPVVVSFVPGIGFPPGVRDTNFSFGIVGSGMRNVNGISASGVFDIVEESLRGVQAAGVFSIAGGKVRGGQFSGVFNIGGVEMHGVQAAGVFNIAEDVLGIQSAGVFNIAKDVRGIQTAGVFNAAHDVSGAQVSGFVNVAKDVRGTQIGVVNFSENCYGIPIGLINITKNGIRDVGFWMDGSGDFYGYSANGTNNFYTLLFAGESLDGIGVNWDTFSAGAGIGYRLKLGPLHLDTDLSAKAFFGNSWRNMLVDIQDGGIAAQDYYSDLLETRGSGNLANAGWPYGPVSFFPMARVTLGIPVLKVFEVFGGVSLDIGVDGTFPVPEILRDVKSYGADIFGVPVEVYPRFFWGINI
jgi:hypothetical protein